LSTSATLPGQAITRLAVDPPTILLCCISKFTLPLLDRQNTRHKMLCKWVVKKILTVYIGGMTEKEIETYFVRKVRSVGGIAYKFRSVSQRGVADRIACMPNSQAWFVELKKPGGRLSPLQEIFAEEMQQTRQHYACLWSKEDVDQWLKNLGL